MSRLRDFGLSEYAARAYLALLDLGLTEARDVSTLSKVPTSKIYHILDQLHEKGLVIVLPEFPKKYAPVPFDDYLEKLRRGHEEAALSIERERDDLAALFSVLGDVAAMDRGNFTVIRGRRNVLAKYTEIMATATREILGLGSRGIPHRVDAVADALERARARGVRARMLVPVEEATLAALGALEGVADVRVRELDDWKEATHVDVCVADHAQAIIIHFSPDDGNPYQGKDVAIHTDHQAMVATLRALLEPHYARATTLAARRVEISEGRLPEFTRFYDSEPAAGEAFRTAMARGCRECRYAGPVEDSPERGGAIGTMLGPGVHGRLLTDAADVDRARSVARALAAAPNLEARHHELSLGARFAVIDEREAFFSVARPDAPAAPAGAFQHLVVHTSNPPTVRSLAVSFEEMWSAGRPLAVRLRELESSRPAPATQFFRASEDAIAASREVVEAAHRELRIVALADDLARVAEGAPAQAALARGVRVRILTTVTPESRDAAIHAALAADVRHVPAVSILGNSADGQEVFVVLPRRSGPGGPVADPKGLLAWTDRSVAAVRSSDPVYVTAFDGFFDGQWDVATPLAARLAELAAASERVRVTP